MTRLLPLRRRPWSARRACSGCRGDEGRQAAAPDASWLGSTKVEGCSTIGETRDSTEPPRTRWWSPIGSMLLCRRSRLVYRTASTACASSGCTTSRRYALQHHCASPHAVCACSPSGSPLPIGLATAYTLSAAWQRHLVPISLAARGGVGPSRATPPYLFGTALSSLYLHTCIVGALRAATLPAELAQHG